uniref:Putative helicase senataxin n=1 Tax=Ictalurus punctatus TaxID=7998 RepID=W5UB54_ICTPU
METCLWCTASAESDAAVTRVLNRYCTDAMTPKEMQDANSDFIYCLECVVEYHRARERVPALHKHLWKLETARLLKVFRDMLEADLEDSDLFFVDDEQEQPVSKFTPEEFLNGLRFPLMEVLKYPYLLCDRDLCEMVVNVLCKMEDMQNPLPVHDQYQGIYLLMVHPNEKVRHWAIATARSLGRVDRDNYYDLQEVFLCMFYIIDLGITVDFPNVDDSYCSGKLQMLPPHLYDSKNKKNYWLGICMLLMQLDSQAMDSLLMGPEGQASIPQCIINTMNDCNKDDPGSDPFWPALHCFLVVLDRLGSKIWGQIEPLDAFQAITKADSYMAEIKNIRQKTAGTRVKEETENHDDLLSCSQIVYDCYATERTSRSSNYSSGNSDTSGNAVFEEISCLVNVLQSEMGQGMRVYGSTFLWFIPFVRSIMELNVLNSICIGEVIHYLDNNADKDVLSGRTHTCDKVTEFFIRILVDIIELHLSKGCMETLSYFTHIWVDLVMQCATLSGDIFHTRIHEGRGVFAASSHFSRGTRMPAVGVGVGAVSQACMKLIRSLLKEGGPTATETAPFLNLVNKQMRSVSARGWNLPKSEYENLKKCLIKLVKAISERPAVPNDVLPCAPPTPPSEPSENIISYPNPTLTPPLQQVQTRDVEVGPSRPIGTIDFIKNEPPWDHGECQSFYDGQEEMIKIKKEACKPIPCSEFGSPPEVNYIKKIDLGKGQETESGKIRDVTKKKFETEDEQGKCSGLKEFGHASDVSLQPSTSQSNVSGSARFSKSCKRTLDDDDDDDEPFDVRLRRLKRPVESCNENSTESRQVSIPLPSSAEKVDEASVIATSEVSSNDQKLLENRVARDPSFDSSTSPGRCYDYLSESQLFECETEEYVASAWNEPDTDVPVVTKKQKLDSKACISPEAVEPMQSPEAVEPMQSPEAVEPMQTQPVPDEDVERACLQVEAQICKQQQPHEPTTSNIQVPSKPSSNEKYDFVQSKHFKSPPEKTGLTDKKGKQWLCRKPPVIEALSQKIKKHCRTHNISPNPVKPCSSTTLTVASPSMVVPSRGCPASSVARSPSTPAIVPPKKVRKRAEPESPAELLGLKKKERKAFDLSQRSLVSLGELRSHGQNVHVEPQQKSKRVRQKKVGAKKGKKMLASQDMQYFIQSRRMLQKPTAATGVVAKSNKFTVPETLSKSKPAIETVSESGDEEDDYDFLPCSQPDPDRRVDSKTGSCQVNTHLSDESKKAVNDWSENITSKEFSSHQNNKGPCSSMPEGAESRDGNCGGDDDDEWTSLTQNEPTDMELCSQMEQMEVEYGESLYTVSDFGNQPNISKGETNVPLQPLSGNPPQKSLPDASTEMSSNEHLFLKPSMPPECQKKTKPSTTKIYSSNSRSATLVKEMGKVANPPSAANVAKAKVARPPPAMPPPPLPKPPPKSTPQPEFRQPLPPRPSLNPLKPDLKSSLSSVTSASHVPSYKTYPRPEAPVPIQTPTVAQNRRPDNTPMYEPSYLKRAILKWEYHMFDNYRMFGTPKDLCPFALKEVPTNFYSYQEYFNILYPLLLINTFEEMVREWLNGRKVRIELHVQAIEYHNCIASASFKVCLNAEQVKKQLYPREDDLVLLWLPENTGAYANDEPGFTENIHFGCVVKSMLSNGGPLYLTIQTRGNVSSVNTQPVRCEVIGSLISTLREFRALCLLQKSKLELPVLKPDMKYFAPCQDDLTNLDMPEYNRDQAKAISCGVAMVKRKQNTPKILLIHGPPGTGKSKIIVGMLHRFLSDGESPSLNRYAKSRRRRILLCTPSNAAIDNLMKKIIILFKDMCLDKDAPQGNCGDINLVRLGSERTISEYLTPFSLDSQVKKRLEKAQQICDSDIQRKKEELDKQIEKLSRQCAETGKKSATFEQLNARKLKCLQEREELSKQLKEFRSKRQSVQSRLLHDAHVICCTLSTSGSTLLEFAFRNLGHEPFNCVIVDEAGQAKETETLIPLLYRCPNLILVGDPMQLPPTVVSQTAKQLGYDQSLMARLCKTRLYPSIFLSFQYRMHPVICEFPSKYIYNNDLKSDRETARKLCSSSWPFEPYRVFDVIDGKERREGDSFSNLKEVNLVLLLLKLLGEKHAMRKEKQQIRAGIITPYNAQKQRLLQALQNDTDKEYKKCIQVEVDTVDGFQGREMDCIIVSCVRASNENGSIGFVANRQRMNVTITRAKFSLFILGHLCTLKQSEWGALIEDAKARGTVIEAHESNFHQVTKKVLKPIPFSHSHSYPPNIPASSEDHRMHTRPSDPRLAEAHRSSREQDGANQSFTHPRPPSRRPSDPRFQQSSARSFRAPPERRYDRHNASSGSCRAYRK